MFDYLFCLLLPLFLSLFVLKFYFYFIYYFVSLQKKNWIVSAACDAAEQGCGSGFLNEADPYPDPVFKVWSNPDRGFKVGSNLDPVSNFYPKFNFSCSIY